MIATQSATFTVAANGSPTPFVDWQVSKDGGKTFTGLIGATIDTLTMSNVITSMNGYEYRAEFTNSGGTIDSSAATLTVLPAAPPVVTGNPTNQTVTEGQTATFTVSASGRPTPTVPWELSPNGGKTWLNDGVMGTTLVLNNVNASMNGYEFLAVISNGVGVPVTTSAATLNLIGTSPPTPKPIWHGNLEEDVKQFDQYVQLLVQAELNADAFFYFHFYYSDESSPFQTNLATDWSGDVAAIYQAALNYEAAFFYLFANLLELANGNI